MISVVIPCYRCAATIKRALQSVDQQTLRPAEVILVEDFSEDGTLEQLNKLQSSYPPGWIKILTLEENSGPAAARNAGWNLAAYEYLAFLDADDAWHPQKLEHQYTWMQAHPQVTLTGHACIAPPHPPFKLLKPPKFKPISGRKLLLSNCFSTPGILIKRRLSYRFATGKYYAEDYLLWCELALDGHLCFYSDAPLAYLFKAEYGEAGLSSHLWKMQKGELDTYRRLKASSRLAAPASLLLSLWSLLKFIRRLLKKTLARS